MSYLKIHIYFKDLEISFVLIFYYCCRFCFLTLIRLLIDLDKL